MKTFQLTLLSLLLAATLAGGVPVPVFAQSAPAGATQAQQTGGINTLGSQALAGLDRTGKNTPGFFSVFSWNDIAGVLGETMLSVAGVFTWAGGVVLNTSVSVSVVNMGALVGQVKAIDITWGVLRDLANIFFIFILLAIGIATILQVEAYGMRSLLAQIIIIAVLINFSLFFTKVIIDTSNLFAAQFYQALNLSPCQGSVGRDSSFANLNCANTGLSERFVEAMKLQSLFGTSAFDEAKVPGGADQPKLSGGRILLIAFLGSIFLVVAGFIFFAAGVLFAARFAVLIMLMVLSPLAYIAMALPKTKAYASQWWDMLLKQSLFAPIYLLLIWISLKILEDPNFSIIPAENVNFAAALYGIDTGVVVFVNFMIVTAFLIFALVVSKQLGAYGAEGMVKLGHSIRKWGQGVAGAGTLGLAGLIGRNLPGRLGSKIASLPAVKDFAARSRFGEYILKGARGVAGSSFDARATGLGKALTGAIPGGLGKAAGKGGYEETLKQQTKARAEFAESIKGKTLSREQEGEIERIRESMTPAGERGRAVEEAKQELKQARANLGTARFTDEGFAAAEQTVKEKEARLSVAEEAMRQADAKIKKIEESPRGPDRREGYLERIKAQREVEAGFMVPRKNKEGAEVVRKTLDKEGYYDDKAIARLDEAIKNLKDENDRLDTALKKAQEPLVSEMKRLGEALQDLDSKRTLPYDPEARDAERQKISLQMKDVEQKLEEISKPVKEQMARNEAQKVRHEDERKSYRQKSERKSAQKALEELVKKEVKADVKTEVDKGMKEARETQKSEEGEEKKT